MSDFRRETNLLLRSIKSGDIPKQKILFDTTYNHLKGIAYKYAKDKNDVEDILAESYIRVFRYIESFNIAKDGYNWLCKIVQNLAYDYNNKTELFAEFNEETEDNFYYNLNIEDRNVLYYELSKLTQYEQDLIYLRFWKALSYSELADKLKSKKSTIHKQINKILKKLNKNFNK